MEYFSNEDWMRIDVANHYGFDKESWEHRIAWTMTNESDLLHPKLVKEADDPVLYQASVMAFEHAKTGAPNHYPVGIDATASGAQILACLIGCETSARLCNVIDTGKREDLYTNIYQGLRARAKAADVPIGSIARSDAKQAVMTVLYGSEAEPRAVFGDGPLLDLFYETMYDMAPGIMMLNDELLQLWDPSVDEYQWIMPDGFHVHAKVRGKLTYQTHFMGGPEEIHVTEVMPQEEGRSISANVAHSVDGFIVREIYRRCNVDLKTQTKIYNLTTVCHHREDAVPAADNMSNGDRLVQKLCDLSVRTGFLSARILPHLTENNIGMVNKDKLFDLLSWLPAKPFEIITVHDRFGVLPNFANDLRQQYNWILSEIAASSMLASIVGEIRGSEVGAPPVEVCKMGDIAEQVVQANYALS